MDGELQKLRSPDDFGEKDASRFAHYQPLTLEDPDEVWLEETESGDRHFRFISHFGHGEAKISYVVVCLTLDAEPSFVFLSFATKDENLVEEYRRGVDLRVDQDQLEEPDIEKQVEDAAMAAEQLTARISDLERLYTELRQPGDIPREEFDKYEAFVEPTLDDPDEIWQLTDAEGNEWYTFIARQSSPDALTDDDDLDELEMGEDAPPEGEEGEAAAQRSSGASGLPDQFLMIVVCEASKTDGSKARNFEVVFAFPTLDPGLVQHFRKGINSLNKAFGTGGTRRRAA